MFFYCDCKRERERGGEKERVGVELNLSYSILI